MADFMDTAIFAVTRNVGPPDVWVDRFHTSPDLRLSLDTKSLGWAHLESLSRLDRSAKGEHTGTMNVSDTQAKCLTLKCCTLNHQLYRNLEGVENPIVELRRQVGRRRRSWAIATTISKWFNSLPRATLRFVLGAAASSQWFVD